jgi:hypothetical protein
MAEHLLRKCEAWCLNPSVPTQTFLKRKQYLETKQNTTSKNYLKKEKSIEEVNVMKERDMHIWKYHNKTPHLVQLIYANKINFKNPFRSHHH